MPFPSRVERTTARPGTAGTVAVAAPASEPKLMKNEVKRFFMGSESGVQDSDNGYSGCPVQGQYRGHSLSLAGTPGESSATAVTALYLPPARHIPFRKGA
jgi:hypothetical protein